MPVAHRDYAHFRLCRQEWTLTWWDMVKNEANRFIYSRFHIFLYLVLALLSLMSLILVSNFPSCHKCREIIAQEADESLRRYQSPLMKCAHHHRL
jgi:hypothetical protein